ncbi:MAG: DUF5671 domain-containing protein [Anaerolineales bacterium]|nr:DUF5671 domain-containing protein [Anaerolineales bacterium]
MQTIRRLYFYAVAMVSLEVVLWGSIGLLRSFFGGQEIGGGGAERLAGALALILVGIPVFLIHWGAVQRSLAHDPAERSARLRAVFLYGTLLTTLVPVAQNLLALINRALFGLLNLDPLRMVIGGGQDWLDNLVAILANLAAGFYFARIVKGDWQSNPTSDDYPEIRRLYRLIWLLYGLVFVAVGLGQIVYFLLSVWGVIGEALPVQLANGLAFLLVGTPLWLAISREIQRTLAEPAERDSMMRVTFLYLLVLISVIGTLAAAGQAIFEILKALLGVRVDGIELLGDLALPFSTLIPFGLIWFYYGRSLEVVLSTSAMPAAPNEAADESPAEKLNLRQADLRRLYGYVLAALGLGAAFSGLQALLSSLLELGVGSSSLGLGGLRNQLAGAIAALLVGLPVWITQWRLAMREAGRDNEAGDLARRSLIRRSYLYLALFAGVLGVMFSAGALLYQLIRSLLGDPVDNLLLVALQQLATLLLFGALLGYHWLCLQADNRLAEQNLARRYAQYPVLILAPEASEFGALLSQAIQKQAPGLPVAVHPLSQGVPDASLSAARAVILTAEMVGRPSEALRLWLQGYGGERLVLAEPAKNWYWFPAGPNSIPSMARQAAQVVARLAEGEVVATRRESPAWQPVVYVMAALFSIQLILGLLIFIASSLF